MRFLTFAFALFAAPAVADTAYWKSVGWWDIAYHDEYGGCAAIAEFQNQTSVFIGLDRTTQNLGLRIGLMSDKWSSINEDEQYNVVVQFDRRAPWDVVMFGFESGGTHGLYNLFPATSQSSANFTREFRRSNHMVWSYQGSELGDFSLKSTNLAINEVMTCTEQYMRSGGSDPFAGGNNTDPFK